MYAAYRWYSYLRCSPFDWNFSSTGYIVTTFLEISRHPKITNLQEKKTTTINKYTNTHRQKKTKTKTVTSQLYLACCPIVTDQNIPGCQISVHKSFPCQVLHTRGYLTTKVEAHLWHWWGYKLPGTVRLMKNWNDNTAEFSSAMNLHTLVSSWSENPSNRHGP